jgi:ankyrin repeat protein
MLIDRGADLNLTDRNGQTPLHQGCSNGDGSIVTMLIDRGAELNVADRHGSTPLHIACNQINFTTTLEAQLEIIRMLILAGADTQARDRKGCLPVDMLPAGDNQSREMYEEAVVEEESQALKPVLK